MLQLQQDVKTSQNMSHTIGRRMSYLDICAVGDDDNADVQGKEEQRHLAPRHGINRSVVEGSTHRQVALEGD